LRGRRPIQKEPITQTQKITCRRTRDHKAWSSYRAGPQARDWLGVSRSSSLIGNREENIQQTRQSEFEAPGGVRKFSEDSLGDVARDEIPRSVIEEECREKSCVERKSGIETLKVGGIFGFRHVVNHEVPASRQTCPVARRYSRL